MMTYGELRDYIAQLRASGADVVPYMVALQRKVAFPFVTLIMTLLAVPFAVTTGRRGALYGIGVGHRAGDRLLDRRSAVRRARRGRCAVARCSPPGRRTSCSAPRRAVHDPDGPDLSHASEFVRSSLRAGRRSSCSHERGPTRPASCSPCSTTNTHARGIAAASGSSGGAGRRRSASSRRSDDACQVRGRVRRRRRSLPALARAAVSARATCTESRIGRSARIGERQPVVAASPSGVATASSGELTAVARPPASP